MSQSIKIDPFGFREYDARWIYEKDINEPGITNLGKGLGTQIKKHTKKDFGSSLAKKISLVQSRCSSKVPECPSQEMGKGSLVISGGACLCGVGVLVGSVVTSSRRLVDPPTSNSSF